MTITALLVKELRERTGAGMMECKKALEETQGDIEVAIIAMRKSGQAKVAKKSSRVAAEGAITIKVSDDCKKAIILEVNCETDFVARDHSFLEFINTIAIEGLAASTKNIDDLLTLVSGNGKSISQMREDLISKIGENINIRRMVLLVSSETIGSYVHNNSRIGVLVDLYSAGNGNKELGKDIAMQIAANKPMVVLPEELPPEVLSKEKEICLAQVQSSGKSQAILEKIISGRMQKFVNESSLIGQAFVKNPDITVADLLQQNHAQVFGFVRFEVGEGIEKKEVDFATEVKGLL